MGASLAVSLRVPGVEGAATHCSNRVSTSPKEKFARDPGVAVYLSKSHFPIQHGRPKVRSKQGE